MAAIGYHAFSKRMHQFASSAGIYSTTTGCYGISERKTEVPRTALMDALEKRTALRMVRSNRVAAGKSETRSAGMGRRSEVIRRLQAIAQRGPLHRLRTVVSSRGSDRSMAKRRSVFVESPLARRPLKIFAFDPMLGRAADNRISIDIANEPLAPGPHGSRVQVVDYDGANKCYYEPINLDHPSILMQGGLAPTESDPRFHQQMVYAVAMKVIVPCSYFALYVHH